jgi:hypothetical protein
MSIFWKEDLGLIFFLKPCERSSITKTSKFFLIKKSTKCEPINPAPPVTIIFAFDTNVLYQHPKLFLFSMHVHRFCKYQYFPFLFLARSVGIAPPLRGWRPLAGPEGIEPPLEDLESPGLPLTYGPIPTLYPTWVGFEKLISL